MNAYIKDILAPTMYCIAVKLYVICVIATKLKGIQPTKL